LATAAASPGWLPHGCTFPHGPSARGSQDGVGANSQTPFLGLAQGHPAAPARAPASLGTRGKWLSHATPKAPQLCDTLWQYGIPMAVCYLLVLKQKDEEIF